MEKRLGFHYFQDYDHYQARDLELWIPELASLQASWLVLKAPAVAAIPEEFITSLIHNLLSAVHNPHRMPLLKVVGERPLLGDRQDD